MQDATFSSKRQYAETFKHRKISRNEASDSIIEIFKRQTSDRIKVRPSKSFARSLPSINLTLQPILNPTWLDQRIVRSSITIEDMVSLIDSVFGDIDISDNSSLWYNDISELYELINQSNVVKNSYGLFIQNDEIYAPSYLDFFYEDFDFHVDFLSKMIGFSIMDLIGMIDEPVNNGGEMIDVIQMQLEEIRGEDEETQAYYEEILKMLETMNVEADKLNSEYHKFGYTIFNDVDDIIDLLHYNGYVESAKWLHSNRKTLDYIKDIKEEYNQFEVHCYFPIGVFPSVENKMINCIREHYDQIEPMMSMQKDLQKGESIRLPILHLAVYNFIDKYWSILCQEYRIIHKIKN